MKKLLMIIALLNCINLTFSMEDDMSIATAPEMAEFLPEPMDQEGHTLIEAAKTNNTHLALTLIHNGTAILHSKDADEWCALHHAAFHNNSILVQALITSNIYPNMLNHNGMTALHIAAIFNYSEIAQMLVDCIDTDLDIKNNNNQTALEIAQERGHQETIQILQGPNPENTPMSDMD